MVAFSRRQLMVSTLGMGLGLAAQRGVGDDSLAAPEPSLKGAGRIFGPGPEGWWDSERVSCPRVLRNPDGGWIMW